MTSNLLSSTRPSSPQKLRPWHDLVPEAPMLRPAEVKRATGLSKSQIYDLISQGFLPPFIKIGPRASAMPKNWLDAYIREQANKALTSRE